MKKIITIIGARPQFIKMPLVSREIGKFAKEIIIHTGQHYDKNMSDIFWQDLNITKPKYNLNIGSGNQGEQTGKMLIGLEKILLKERPDMVLIYGDTNSTLAGALAAAKLHIPIAHVEAGLRSYNREMPEEHNRVLSDHVADLLFCPTKKSVENLTKEGITKGVFWTGDVMYDIFKLKAKSLKSKVKSQKLKVVRRVLETYDLKSKTYILVTVHRQENTDKKENLANIIKALIEIKADIVWPIHPRAMKYLKKYRYDILIAKHPHIRLIEPAGYLEMIALENDAKMILTDSGGLQKEAYWAAVPCITLRNETEWTETVDSGWNRLAGANSKKIIRLVQDYSKPSKHPNYYGNGDASVKIATLIKNYLK